MRVHKGKIIFWGISIGIVLLVFSSFTQPVLILRKKDGAYKVSSERLKSHVVMLSKNCFPRDSNHPENLNKAATYIEDEFRKAGGSVKEQSYIVENREYRNIITQFGPQEGERIIIGAHYDAFAELPGADDNASGVAGLIELAYLLGPTEPETCVELVAYTLEEPPFFSTVEMGSAVHAESIKSKNISVKLMIVLEMIGYFSDEKGSQRFPSIAFRLLYPSRGNFILVAGRLEDAMKLRKVKKAMLANTKLPVKSLAAPASFPGISESDHMNYWKAGYPAIMVTDTADFRNDNYHAPTDTAETLDYERMAMVVEGVFFAIQEVAR